MEKTLRVGILRETKNPPDRRVPLTPRQIIDLEELYPFIGFFIQPGDFRCFTNDEYEQLDIPLKEDLHDCDILMGVKEVDHRTLIPGKTYMFFAHVGKKQPQNFEMFREMALRKISLIDYEYLHTDKGERVVAFGRWAGIIGAYNALRTRGLKTNKFKLKPAFRCHDLNEMWAGLRLVDLEPRLKIVVTGKGRVAGGALETLSICNLDQVSHDDFLSHEFNVPVVCQIGPDIYTKHKNRQKFNFSHFTQYPEEYESAFIPFTEAADILVAGHYWDPASPVLFTREDMNRPKFRISVIADISCDINGSIPSTIRSSTISDPFYGYNPVTGREEPPFTGSPVITVMAIDNLPGELPRDASHDFGEQLMKNVLPLLFVGQESKMIENATILKNGRLTHQFSYLDDYLDVI